MNNDYRDFSLRLKEERTRLNLTQQQLCSCTKIQQSSFSKAEAGYIRLTYSKLKELCTAGMDIFYVFTDNRAPDILSFSKPPEATSEELFYLLSVIHVHANAARIRNRISPKGSLETSFEQVWKQLEYLQYLPGNARTDQNIFYCLRNHHGYTQEKMAHLLGMDIKTLRNLEKGRRLPDSEIIWKMYYQFHVSPAFILKDPEGLWRELNYVLGLMEDDAREIMLRVLKDGYDLVWARDN